MRVEDLFECTGKIALVTGGSKGLGKAMAEALVAAGATVVITSRKYEELILFKKEFIEKYQDAKVHIYEFDHSNWKDSNKLIDLIEKEVGEIEILVNNAGTGLVSEIEKMTDDQWQYIMDLNLSSHMALSRRVISNMVRKQWGRIINTASLFGMCVLENRTAYCSSKGAVIQFTKALAIEAAQYSPNITVNCISCGPMRTPLMKESWNNIEKRKFYDELTALKRWGEPKDIMGAVLLLASNAGSYITGHNLFIDGGASAK